jgi:hypothetical protein
MCYSNNIYNISISITKQNIKNIEIDNNILDILDITDIIISIKQFEILTNNEDIVLYLNKSKNKKIYTIRKNNNYYLLISKNKYCGLINEIEIYNCGLLFLMRFVKKN